MGSIACSSKNNRIDIIDKNRARAFVDLSIATEINDNEAIIIKYKNGDIAKLCYSDPISVEMIEAKDKYLRMKYKYMHIIIAFILAHIEIRHLCIPEDIMILIHSCYQSIQLKLKDRVFILLKLQERRNLYFLFVKSKVEFYKQCISLQLPDEIIEFIIDTFIDGLGIQKYTKSRFSFSAILLVGKKKANNLSTWWMKSKVGWYRRCTELGLTDDVIDCIMEEYDLFSV